MADKNEEEEFNTTFYSPQNYSESGKILGGMFETRNVVEAAMIFALIGYPEFKFINLPIATKAVIMLLTIFPPVILSLTGIDGYPLSQYVENIIKYLTSKRKLHFRRVGYSYVQKTNGNKKTAGKKTGESKKTETTNSNEENENE